MQIINVLYWGQTLEKEQIAENRLVEISKQRHLHLKYILEFII